MVLPPNKTEKEVLDAIEKAVSVLAPSFVFGYYDLEDIKQEGRLFGLKCLEKYDPTRPLDNFVYTHIRNRYINLRRNKLKRNDPPCLKCHTGSPCQDDGGYCERYANWFVRNAAKANIMRPLDISNLSDENENWTKDDSYVVSNAEMSEIVKMIDEKLPIELRATYLQMRDGVSVPKAKRMQVEEAVKEILKCQNEGL